MFGLMLVRTHRAKLEEMAKQEARHQKSIDDTLSTLRSQLATADSRGQKMASDLATARGELTDAKQALATCRNHAETLTAKITADEPFVAAGKAAKAAGAKKPARGTTAKASAARSAPDKSNVKAK